MNYIQHIIEPQRLLLTWQSTSTRLRRVVAELIRTENGNCDLNYLVETKDYNEAVNEGFQGFATFPLGQPISNAMDIFLKRQPPRAREDFNKYLEALRILPDVAAGISDFALLGYSGAKLPDDNFAIVHPFDGVEHNCEILTEICGFRHNNGAELIKNQSVSIGDSVELTVEPNNQYDSNAIMIEHNGIKLGYINRAQLNAFNCWLKTGVIDKAVIERVNGFADNPKLYIFVEVK
ncbi:MAG: hypothetical protein FD145_988 [Candidatus Saganbacteria bacterium]|uniref:HIRAN domain-containing protein n=1 Tax=Candidatus Saganbacteria bacterium TaxID=2575572 RepID=A0A833NYE6_UNCSA|nr:MAG: hypothetical protein FD145_988 [Candidatus Saganbacteria bacterium]